MALSKGSWDVFAPTMGVTKLVALPSYAVAKALQARPGGTATSLSLVPFGTGPCLPTLAIDLIPKNHRLRGGD
jgi:hypothetical protein